MPYISVSSFKQGLDARRGKINAQQGSLQAAVNCHINRGGEIEKRKAFVPKYALPAGQTFGLHATRFGVYVFGSADPAGLSIPSGVRYQRLVAPSSPDLTEVVSVDSFNSVPYVVARFSNGTTHHFYNGIRVTDWDTVAPSVSNLSTLAQALADLIETDPDVSATYASIAGVDTITITASAQAVDIPITANVQNAGAVANNSVTTEVTTPAAPSVAQVVTLELTGTYTPATDAEDLWTVTVADRIYRLTGSASGVGSTARTFRGKVYATVQGLLYFSDAQDPTRWTSTFVPDPAQPDKKVDTFAGFESVSSQIGGSDSLVAVSPYQNFMAIFSRRNTQVWSIVPGDPKDNVPVQILDNIGTMAHRSAVSFGELDVFFLSDSGIRSLRARDASNAAVVFDVGTSIDPIVTAKLSELSETQIQRACGVIEPREGRYMLAIGPTIFVYSFFPASGISAWSTYDAGFEVSDFAAFDGRLFVRSGDTIYLYGGDSGDQYDTCEAFIDLSWLDAEKPAHRKRFVGLDVSCEGLWKVEYNTNPRSDEFVVAGFVEEENFSLPHFRLSGTGTHIGLRFSTNESALAKLSSAAIHIDWIDNPK